MVFDSRLQAGILLGEELKRRDIKADIVFGLARGGVVVAAEVARILESPLETLIVRKVGAPGNPEFAVGAAAEGAVWWDEDTLKRLRLDKKWQKQQIEDKKIEISEYIRKIGIHKNIRRSSKKLLNIVLVDDGAATGISMMAAIGVIRKVDKSPAFRRKAGLYQIIVALPVASAEATEMLGKNADEVVILHTDQYLGAVRAYYRQFKQVNWDEVKKLLKSSYETTKKIN